MFQERNHDLLCNKEEKKNKEKEKKANHDNTKEQFIQYLPLVFYPKTYDFLFVRPWNLEYIDIHIVWGLSMFPNPNAISSFSTKH